MNDSQMPPGGMKTSSGKQRNAGQQCNPGRNYFNQKRSRKMQDSGENTTKYLDKLKSEIEIAQYDFNLN